MKKLLLITLISIAILSCKNEKQKMKNEIDDMEKTAFADTTGTFMFETAAGLVDKYIDYADKYPDEKESAEYLFKAAEISMNMGNHMQSIQLFDRYREQYPDNEKAPMALFFKGFVYDDRLKDFPAAEAVYNEFLQLYPNHEMADDVQSMKTHLGKTDEEIIREFEKRLQDQEESLKKQPI